MNKKSNLKSKFVRRIAPFAVAAPVLIAASCEKPKTCDYEAGELQAVCYLSFPKNNHSRDVMIDAPSLIDEEQKLK